MKKLLVMSSPSGGGKTTVAKYLLTKYPFIRFSISATTRQPRRDEIDGKDYFFLTREQFERKIAEGAFVEYEEIFGNYYGTLHSEIERVINSSSNEMLLFDVDVNGALSLQRSYPNDTILVFISPPSIQVLEERLRKRLSENEEEVMRRISRSLMEMNKSKTFDHIILNDVLSETYRLVDEIIEANFSNK